MQNRIKLAISDIDLNVDLYSLLSFHDRDFLIEFSTQPVAGAFIRALTFDGEMNYETIWKLKKASGARLVFTRSPSSGTAKP